MTSKTNHRVWKYKNGTYAGQWQGEAKHGLGIYTYKSGSSFAGEFKHDKQEGVGLYTLADGESYAGDNRGGLIDGLGVYTFRSGCVFLGEFREGKQNGVGVYCQKTGAAATEAPIPPGVSDVPVNTFMGEWRDGRRNGLGVHCYDEGHPTPAGTTGGSYAGEFRENQWHGSAVYTDRTGERTFRTYDNNVQISCAAYDGANPTHRAIDERVAPVKKWAESARLKALVAQRCALEAQAGAMAASRRAGEGEGADRDESTRTLDCTVCLDKPAVMAVIGCGHRCLCEACAKSPALKGLCPVCRGKIGGFQRVYDA